MAAFPNRIHIDKKASRITLSIVDGTQLGATLLIKGKEFEFICLLIAAEDFDFQSTEDVYALALWRNMKINSVGKQIARLIDYHKVSGLSIVDYKQKTEGWRLHENVAKIVTSSMREQAKRVIELASSSVAMNERARNTHSIAYWTSQNAKALLKMTSGAPDTGYQELKLGFQKAESITMQLISNVIATRIGQRLSSPHLPLPLANDPELSVFELAVEARHIAAYALRSRSNDWEAYRKDLQKLMLRVARTGDTTTKAILHNALALILKRQGDFDGALINIELAAPLAIFSGDLILIQNMLFNYGNILSELYRINPSVCTPADYLGLLELDVHMRHSFNLGNDSAQAELLTSFLYFEQQDFTNSQRFLKLAEQIITISAQKSDRALFHRLNGLIVLATCLNNQELKDDGMAELLKSHTLFSELENLPAVEQVEQDMLCWS